jgi:GNAT superfamily N-acetyltransferase
MKTNSQKRSPDAAELTEIRVIGYDDRYLPVFRALNAQWIEQYFVLEAMDLHQLEHPREVILDAGGEIFFVLENGEAVGTCAVVPHGESYEIAKMAVAGESRGKGHGDRLMQAAIDWCRAKGVAEIVILSNTVLAPAITLYKKFGFATTRLGPHPDYERCNIEMKLRVSS